MKISILHYSIPPIVGGVEEVIHAHTRLLLQAGYTVRLIAGVGGDSGLPAGAEITQIREMDSRHPKIIEVSQQLETGILPPEFKILTDLLIGKLIDALESSDVVIAHNVFTKHFNLPLTAALSHLLDRGDIKHLIAWCHDITWTSAHSREKVHPGYPWDLLRTYREEMTYVAVSRARQAELVGLYQCPTERIHVIYNGVDPVELYDLSEEGQLLVDNLGLLEAELILLMPVRITQAKNIELALQVVAGLKGHGLHPKLVITGPPDPHDPNDLEYYRGLLQERQRLDVEQQVRFVYESGPDANSGYTIGLPVVRELFRVCDALFMPSRREGFGMPILEAGLTGMPIFTTAIPAADEIGGQDVIRFSPQAGADEVARLILGWAQTSPSQRLRRRVRQDFTWQAIFRKSIQPLLAGKGAF